ncbi:MAG: dienelactone hydrolase family protein [Rhodospirillales bacterium]
MSGQEISLKASDGHRLSAWTTEPKGDPVGGVVVIQEIFGVNGHIRDVCQRFSEAGYRAVAPALFDRRETGVELDYDENGKTRGRKLRTALDWDESLADIRAAIDSLAPLPVAAVGFCWGGSLAFLTACRLPVAAAVGYYGGQIKAFPEETLNAPVILHFGDGDPLISAADRAQVAQAYPDIPQYVYDAGHGFNCDRRADFRPEAAALAWQRTLNFLSTSMA